LVIRGFLFEVCFIFWVIYRETPGLILSGFGCFGR